MNDTDIVLDKIRNDNYVCYSFCPGFKHVSIKYNSRNRIEVWVDLNTSITEFSSSYAQYMVKHRLPRNGLSPDEYFNISLVLDVPDVVLEPNLKKILDAVQNKVNHHEYSIEIKLC